MKKISLLAILMLLAVTTIFAQQNIGNLKRTAPHTTVASNNIKITYGQPSKNGKELFGNALPYKKVWAPGADEPTLVTFKKDFIVNGRSEIKAGTYSLYVIPDCKGEWTFVLNAMLHQNINDDYSKIQDKQVVASCVATKQLDHVVEQLTFTPKEDGFLVEWDQTSCFFKALFY